jgi:Zn-dependent protease with chaperone function
VVQPAIMTLQAWSRRAEVTCDRAALLAVRDLDKTLQALVSLELGLDRGAAFPAEDYLKSVPDVKDVKDVKKGFGRYAELFRSNPNVAKRVQALRLFAGSAMYAQATGGDPLGKPSLADVDKQVADLISVL